MKVNELSKLTGVHQETIRMYRNEGLLHPIKLQNGYYDYSMQDYVSLLHIRKLREFHFSLDTIQQTSHADSLEGYLSQFQEKEIQMRQEIKQIEEKLSFIQFEKNHILSSLTTAKTSVTLDQSIDEKIDVYPPFQQDFSLLPTNIPSYYFYTTTPIHISKDILNGEIKDETIPTKVGVGTYRSIYNKLNISIPKNAIVVPNGLCVSQIVMLEDLTHINIQSLQPMMSYAKKINKPFLSDTTGYLIGILYQNNKPYYCMRIRSCIEKNDIISPQRMF